MKLGARSTTGWRATISVAMSNYIEAGSIIAIATSLTFWQHAYGLSNLAVGVLAAFSANAFGTAIGAGLGGPLCDRFGRKAIYTYDLLVYMLGVLIAACAANFGMLLVGFLITGIAVGAGVPASWTYIAEQAPTIARARHVGTAQLAWSMGPLIGFGLAAALAPLGLLGSRIIFIHLFVVAGIVWWVRQGLAESRIWTEEAAPGSQTLHADSPVGLRGLRGLFSRRINIIALLVLMGVYGFWNTVAGQAGIFMPRVYDSAGVHSAVQQDLLQVLVWGCTVVATYAGFMAFADRVSQRWLYLIGAALGVLGWCVLVFFTSSGMPTLLLFAVLWGRIERPGRPGVLQPLDQRTVRDSVPGQRAGLHVLRCPRRHRPAQLFLPDDARGDRPDNGRPAADRPADSGVGDRHGMGPGNPRKDVAADRDRTLRTTRERPGRRTGLGLSAGLPALG